MVSPEVVASPDAFAYLTGLLPQLITIIAAIASGFKVLQIQNEKKIKEAKEDVLNTIRNEKEGMAKDLKNVCNGIANLDHQYKIITDFIKEQLARHDRMIERIDAKNSHRFGDTRDIESGR